MIISLSVESITKKKISWKYLIVLASYGIAEKLLNNWNGTSDEGEQLQAGTYYYVFYNGASMIKGFVELKY